MLTIYIIDISADARKRVADLIANHLRSNFEESVILPQFSIKSLSPQELKFHGAPDICIVGEDIIATDISAVGRIRKLFPETHLIAKQPPSASHFTLIEQLARLGADDVLEHDSFLQQLVKKLILLARKSIALPSGQLVLIDSGKGGQGVTTVAAALAEVAFGRGQRVLLIDFDFESQDLSRFLQVRPYLNENLRLLLDQQRPVTEEYVDQCITVVWEGDNGLCCMAPPPETDDIYSLQNSQARIFAAIFEHLDPKYDLIIVDVAAARGALRSLLYRMAESVVVVLSNDPASLYASAERISRMRGDLSPESRVIVLQNRIEVGGLTPQIFREEFTRVASFDSLEFFHKPISTCRAGQRWPGSGASFSSQCKSSVAILFEELLSLIRSKSSSPASSEKLLESRELGLLGWAEKLFSRSKVKLAPPSEPRRLLDSPPAVHDSLQEADSAGSAFSPRLKPSSETATQQNDLNISRFVGEPSLVTRKSSESEVA